MQSVSDEGPAWDERWGFVLHYFFGGGRGITVREAGHLEAVVAEYRRQAIDNPSALPGMIADAARDGVEGPFEGILAETYEMQDVVFSIGGTAITAKFSGQSRRVHALLEVQGEIRFELADNFRDPVDLEEQVQELLEEIDGFIVAANALSAIGAVGIAALVRAKFPFAGPLLDRYILGRVQQVLRSPDKLPTELPGAMPYAIVDRWRGTFHAKIIDDREASRFRHKKTR